VKRQSALDLVERPRYFLGRSKFNFCHTEFPRIASKAVLSAALVSSLSSIGWAQAPPDAQSTRTDDGYFGLARRGLSA
jgi:hypothetical protein